MNQHQLEIPKGAVKVHHFDWQPIISFNGTTCTLYHLIPGFLYKMVNTPISLSKIQIMYMETTYAALTTLTKQWNVEQMLKNLLCFFQGPNFITLSTAKSSMQTQFTLSRKPLKE